MTLESNTSAGFATLLEVPFSHIPLDNSVCSNSSIPDGHQNHTHNNNSHTYPHNSTSLADLCTIMPGIAREVSRVQGPVSLQCTTPVNDCSTINCFLSVGMIQHQQQNLSITVLPCTNPPQLEVSVPSGKATQGSVIVYLRDSERIESVINGSTMPLFFNINQRASLLSMGLEVKEKQQQKNKNKQQNSDNAFRMSFCVAVAGGPSNKCNFKHHDHTIQGYSSG